MPLCHMTANMCMHDELQLMCGVNRSISKIDLTTHPYSLYEEVVSPPASPIHPISISFASPPPSSPSLLLPFPPPFSLAFLLLPFPFFLLLLPSFLPHQITVHEVVKKYTADYDRTLIFNKAPPRAEPGEGWQQNSELITYKLSHHCDILVTVDRPLSIVT